jgi:hypothetical protein
MGEPTPPSVNLVAMFWIVAGGKRFLIVTDHHQDASRVTVVKFNIEVTNMHLLNLALVVWLAFYEIAVKFGPAPILNIMGVGGLPESKEGIGQCRQCYGRASPTSDSNATTGKECRECRCAATNGYEIAEVGRVAKEVPAAAIVSAGHPCSKFKIVKPVIYFFFGGRDVGATSFESFANSGSGFVGDGGCGVGFGHDPVVRKPLDYLMRLFCVFIGYNSGK